MWHATSTNNRFVYPVIFNSSSLIVKINNIIGGSTTIDYKFASQVNGAINPSNSIYPYIVNNNPRNLVTKVTTTDGRGASYGTSYDYKNGKIYMGLMPDRKDLIFESMSVTNDQTGEKSVTYCRQDNPAFQGAPLKSEVYAGDGSILKRIEYQYNTNTNSIFYTADNKYTQLAQLNSMVTTNYEQGTIFSVNTKTFQYDSYNNITQSVDSTSGFSDIVTQNSYTNDDNNWILGRPTEIKTISGSTIIKWDRLIYTGNLLTSKQSYLNPGAKWISMYFTYNQLGNVTSVTDPMGHIITTTYDTDYQSFPIRIANAKGHISTAQFDARYGVKTAETDVNGNSTNYEYDQFGRLKKVIEPGDSWTKEIVYNDTGNANTQYVESRIADTSSSGYHYKRVYSDGLMREYKVIQKAYVLGSNQVDQVVDTEFDSKGRISRKSKPYCTGSYNETPLYTQYQYDAMNRPTRVTLPDGTCQQFSYNASGNGTYTGTVTDQKGNIHKSVYNARGKIVQKIEPGNAMLSYAYAPAGELSTVTNPDGRVTSITYDSLGRKLSITDPSTGVTTYLYDDAGRLIAINDAKNQVIAYTYDEINRVTNINYPDGTPDVQYTYDETAVSNGIGRVTRVNDGISESTIAYNAKGAPTAKTVNIDGKQFIFRMAYDNLNRVTELTYPDGKTITREYNDISMLNAVKWDGKPIVRYGRFKVDENGDIESIDNKAYRITGNNVETELSYDTTNLRPTRVITQFKGSTPQVLEDINYAFDNLGNVTSITDNVDGSKSQTFQYDGLNRLVNATGVYGTIQYEYTSNGNLTKKGNLSLNYNSDHPYAVSSDSAGNVFSYDANGNMVSRKDKTLEYDAKNRLTKITNGGTTEAEYLYNNSGQRIKKIVNGSIVTYNIDGLYELTQMPGRDDHHTKYFYGYNNELVAQMTKTNSTLIAMYAPLVINSYYADNTIKGISFRVYQYANYLCCSFKTYRNFIYAMILALFIVLLGNMIYYGLIKPRKRTLVPAWASKIAPLVLIIFVSPFAFTGCEIPYWLWSSGNPWDDTTMPTNITTEGVPVEGMIFFHPDFTGNVSFVTNNLGEKVCQLHYKPYGEIAVKTGVDVFRYKFNTHEQDNESGLLYYKARFYDPAIGRFITPDTIVPDPMKTQSYNRYMYVEGNPITLQDPTGHFWAAFLHGMTVAGQAILHGMTNAGQALSHGMNHVLRDDMHFQNTKSYWERKVVPVLRGIGYGIGGAILGGLIGSVCGGPFDTILGSIIGGINGFRGGFLGIYQGSSGFLAFLSDSTWSLPNTAAGLCYSGYLEALGKHLDPTLSRMTNSYIYPDVGNAIVPPGLTIGNVIGMKNFYQNLLVFLSAPQGSGLLAYGAFCNSIGLLVHEVAHIWQYRAGGIAASAKLLQEQICGPYGLDLYDPYKTNNNFEHMAAKFETKVDDIALIGLNWFGYKTSKQDLISYLILY
jgi:RHS repeat-associated protein